MPVWRSLIVRANKHTHCGAQTRTANRLISQSITRSSRDPQRDGWLRPSANRTSKHGLGECWLCVCVCVCIDALINGFSAHIITGIHSFGCTALMTLSWLSHTRWVALRDRESANHPHGAYKSGAPNTECNRTVHPICIGRGTHQRHAGISQPPTDFATHIIQFRH